MWAAERSGQKGVYIGIHGPWANVKGAAMLLEFMKIRKITMCTTAMGGYGIWEICGPDTIRPDEQWRSNRDDHH